VFVRDVLTAGLCYEDEAVAVAAVWLHGPCALCALRGAAAAAGEKRAAEAAARQPPSKRAAGCTPVAGSSASDDDSCEDDSSSGDDDAAPMKAAAAAPRVEAPPAPPPSRPRAGAAAAPLPRTLGRATGCGARCGCAPGGGEAAAAAGPNPVFVRPPRCVTPASPPVAFAGDTLLGYAVLLRAAADVALFADAPCAEALAACATLRCPDAAGHPRCAAAVHMAPCAAPGAPGAAAYAAAARAALPAATHVAARGEDGALGFLAAARAGARLAALSPRLFPPPPALLQPPASSPPPMPPARLLARLRFRGHGAAAELDEADVPPQPDSAALGAEALAARPRLAEMVAALPMPLRADADADAIADCSIATEQASAPPAPLAGGNAAAAAALRARLTAARGGGTPAAAPPAAMAVPRPAPAPRGDIVFLGTGCAEPSKHRGSAGMLLRVPGYGCALLDCGEGCTGAIRRCLGPAASSAALAALRCVLVSHHHADHLLGLPGVLVAARDAALAATPRGALPSPPPLVVGPPAAAAWLAALPFGAASPPAAFLPLRLLARGAGGAQAALPPVACAALGALGLTRLEAVAVEHCPGAHALLLTHAAGWRLAYSGDCRPSAALAQAAQGATLLVHEATYGEQHAAHAAARRHCTVAEAMGVAAAMRAQHTVLTHFSQRHLPRDVRLAAEEGGDAPAASIAFDGMRLRWDQVRG
jgi:ribonuclease BN (tRNA processing enzyme)